MTREVHEIASVEILGPDSELETVEGTTIHPIWSEDRQDWVPLGELQPGETLRAASGAATVLSVQILNQAVPVYNIEVHGEHVYQVGQLGVLVHNRTMDCLAWVKRSKNSGERLIMEGIEGVIGNFPKQYNGAPAY